MAYIYLILSHTQDPGSTEREDFSQLQNAQFTQFESSQYSQDFESQRSAYSTGCNYVEVISYIT